MAEIYRQCELKRPSETGQYTDVFWIDNKLAKLNKRVIDDDGNIWTITALYNARAFKDVEETIKLWKRFKEVLDG